MTRRLVLHIGDCKTGSTILQSMMARGDAVAEGLRLFTPGAGSHGGLARALGDRPQLYPQRWERMAKRLSEEDCDIAVLSSELFEFIAPEAVGRALETHFPALAAEARVIVYVRPHASRVLSQFAENVKLGHSMGSLSAFADKFMNDGRLDYAGRMERWRAVFGERLVVRPFVRSELDNGDVRHDFMTVLLEGAPYTMRDSGQDDNASLTVPDLALMRLIQSRFDAEGSLSMDSRVAFGKRFGRLLRDNPGRVAGDRLRLTEGLYARLAETCQKDALRMDETWFGHSCFALELERASLGLVSEAQSLDAQEYFTAETLRQARVWAEMTVQQMTMFGDDYAKRLNQS
jgi:hypothetical protein